MCIGVNPLQWESIYMYVWDYETDHMQYVLYDKSKYQSL